MTAWCMPSDLDIRQILMERIDVERQGVGIVVGTIDEQRRRVVAYGASGHGDGRPLDGDTVFEIGSITKVFTSLVLADMVERGEVALDDPAVKYLPPGVTMPERGGKQIALIDLATHTSGLPRLPANMAPKDLSNPYADYSVDQLHEFISTYELRRDIGAAHEYSNLGAGLLGHVLARRAGMDFEKLVRLRITGPLAMSSTAIALSDEMTARLAVGHDTQRRPVGNWDLPTLAGAGGLRSTANDLLTFLAAELDLAETPLKAAMTAQSATHRPTESANLQALGWVITPPAPGGAGEIAWHSGGTGGFRCFLGLDRQQRRGAVVLTNMDTTRAGDDIGFHLLCGRPLLPPPRERRAIALDAAVLERYVGRYQFSGTSSMSVTRTDQRLFFQLTGHGRMELFAESPTDFFLEEIDAQVTFEVDPDGAVNGVVAHQNGRDRPAKRVS